MPSRALRVAIVGGGIGGLSAANALAQRAIDVTVFEQTRVLGEVGAGIFMSPNSLRHLERMGLTEPLAKVGAKVDNGNLYYRTDGTPVASISVAESGSQKKAAYGMHRADLLGVLAAALPDVAINLGYRCIGFEQHGSSARLQFDNNESFEADVVLAADGIHSQLQGYVVAPSQPVHSGSVAYRGLVPREKLPGWRVDVMQMWMGSGKHFLVYPVRRAELINYVAFVPSSSNTKESWSAIGDRDELAAAFAGWDPRVTELLEQVETCFWWGLYDREPLSKWINGRLALLGDAAHPMLPHLGQGANQAIEDGVALAILLEGKHAGNAPQALLDYERLRLGRTSLVQRGARHSGLQFDSATDSLEQRDREISESGKFRKWLYDYDVDAEARAMAQG